ncbi:Na+/H+ antiporter NhaA [Francisella philomiragia]|uniref:Na+/H+ antiporter NhaA n=1 Tax=Francisella philomiragia TaxID=28110 RepID=UPI0001AF7B4A|nr:Na+/H+ antiporter NhaA [Francisella philomiragia]AJI75111.1 Na+/H+ antiporter NhaA [Francisella philomiragia subsp. philomiragia ATCC 25015]EET20623.1 Na+:H+ antiporter [Francisella philomiragia subsp. philomiragia ATCC 25015]MBK2095636.1 Na+/H+ antiporter NhaA [Francisella philomiragia]MBK2237663.1 Na+/H+ antiporter NhaA [Francisella philomiragia]MBK2266919.1 Na+/H+ antiporter NhaA [Francisella philomiragia]
MSANQNNQEIVGGLILFAAAFVAILINNSPLSIYYGMLETINVKLGIENLVIDKNLMHWINDGLMAIYFLYIGLEIKREIISGALSKPSNIIIPAIAALAGLAVPSLIYLSINYDANITGWAIPSATDIAFTLGILALLGSRIPAKLKLLVVTIAIFDDIAAIVIIAIFYTKSLSLLSLSLGTLFILAMIICNRVFKVNRSSVYVVLGFFAWFCTIKSGVHATLAGFTTALCIPFRENDKDSPANFMEESLHPWVIYFILPVFAFANAGINFSGMSISIIFEPITLGIILGLFVGKQLGIFSILAISKKLKLFKLGESFSSSQIYGISLLCGIGFTMSLFIGTLAFDDNYTLSAIKVGVIVGSLLSGICGYIVLRFIARNPH